MAYTNKSDLYKNQVQRWIKRKIDAISYLGGKCEVCGGSFPYPAFDFHHKDPLVKDFVWTKLRLTSWKNITIELDKCMLLCANCHRVIHSSYPNSSISNCSKPLPSNLPGVI